MNILFEDILIYGGAALLCIFLIYFYLQRERRKSKEVETKIKKAKEEGLHEPVSLHPVIDVNRCIRTGACMAACPEKDILGIVNGKATAVKTSQCIGHGACFHACPTEAITLCIGTEKRGVDLPHVNSNFETNIKGIFIAGELGGMGLIRNAVEQGKQAVENIVKSGIDNHHADFDLVIVGAGPAGISGALTAKKNKLRFLLVDQNTLGGTVFTFPRSKVVMTSPMELPLFGKVKLYETSKSELIDLWEQVLNKNNIEIKENTKIDSIINEEKYFELITATNEKITSARVLLAIGRRGSPRKLNVPGEESDKVAYRLLEPELIQEKNILVVGGGDSAVEAALLLKEKNHVILSYRNETFSRIKPTNRTNILKANEQGQINIKFNTVLTRISEKTIYLKNTENNEEESIENDLVYIFAGGELPTEFLKKAGIEITTKFGEAILKHNKNR